MHFDTKYWIRISLFNLLIVSFLGVIMRYKIGFEFPYFEQKYLQHAHSHFAFSAWVSQLLMAYLSDFIGKQNNALPTRPYQLTLWINLLLSYGMLFAFALAGYNFISIAFSVLGILNFYVFAFFMFRDLNRIQDHPAKPWFRAALFFNLLSTLGTYSLAYMMSRHQVHQNWYLGSVYFYLHFQYNGWFLFSVFGLFIHQLKTLVPTFSLNKKIFYSLAFACVPAYLLSTLWLNLPGYLYSLVILAALVQALAWMVFLKSTLPVLHQIKTLLPKYSMQLFLLVASTLSIKFILQLFSTIPSISKLAFGFRPIVIAYLHLVLLTVISLFLLTYTHAFIQKKQSKLYLKGLFLFVSGIFLNEIVLTLQGVASFSYHLIPYANEMLFACSLLIFFGLIALLKAQNKIMR